MNLIENQNLERAHTTIEHVYFIESGLASVVASKFPGLTVEVGLVGQEGMTGTALVQQDRESPFECFVQMEGSALRMTVADLREALKVPVVSAVFLRCARVLGIQTTYTATALASAQTKIEERLARWVLMVHDRIEGDTFFLTHEFLAMMLGVRRPGVTEVLQMLEGYQLIKSRRKEIFVRNGAGLVALTRNTHGPGELEYLRLIGIALAKLLGEPPMLGPGDDTLDAA